MRASLGVERATWIMPYTLQEVSKALFDVSRETYQEVIEKIKKGENMDTIMEFIKIAEKK